MLNKTPPRVVQYTYPNQGLVDSKSDPQVSGSLSRIRLSPRRRRDTEGSNELKILALHNSAERRITPTNTPPSEPEDDIDFFANALDELLQSYGGSQSPQAKLLCLALSISDGEKRKIKNQEEAYTYLQNRLLDISGQALITSVSLNSKAIAKLLNMLEPKKIEKDYDCIVLIADEGSEESLSESINKLTEETDISSNGMMLIHHSSFKTSKLASLFSFDLVQTYDHLLITQCAVSKINDMTKGHNLVLLVSSEEYERLLEKEFKKYSISYYDPAKFKIFTVMQKKENKVSDEVLAQKLSNKVLSPISKLILKHQTATSSIGV
jgi:hypothetical protein